MKIKRIEQRIVTYSFRADIQDPEYGLCMWAKFSFDRDFGTLNITSDAGDFSYRWGFNEHEEFMKLMARINSSYLIDKISSRCKFDLDRSRKELLKNLNNSDYDFGIKTKEELFRINREIRNIEYTSEDMWIISVNSIIPDIDFESIPIDKDYPKGALVISDIFEKYIQPEIKKEIGLWSN